MKKIVTLLDYLEWKDKLKYKTTNSEVILTSLQKASKGAIYHFLRDNDYNSLSDEIKLLIQLKAMED